MNRTNNPNSKESNKTVPEYEYEVLGKDGISDLYIGTHLTVGENRCLKIDGSNGEVFIFNADQWRNIVCRCVDNEQV